MKFTHIAICKPTQFNHLLGCHQLTLIIDELVFKDPNGPKVIPLRKSHTLIIA